MSSSRSSLSKRSGIDNTTSSSFRFGLSDILSTISSRRNPGDFDSLDERASEILQTDLYCFRGAQISLQNVLDKHFLTLHSVELGKKETIGQDGKPQGDKSAYGFTAYYKTDGWLLNGKTNFVSATRAKIDYENEPFSASLQGNFCDDPQKNHLEIDLTVKKWDMCIQAKTSDFMAYGLSFTQAITDKLTTGVEVFSTLDDRSRLKGVTRYIDGDSQLLASASTGLGADQYSVSYHEKIFKHLSVLTSAEFSFGSDKQTRVKEWTSVLKIGYHYSCRENLNIPMPGVRGSLDSSGNIAVFLEEPMGDMILMTLSAKANPVTEDYDFGVGFTLTL